MKFAETDKHTKKYCLPLLVSDCSVRFCVSFVRRLNSKHFASVWFTYAILLFFDRERERARVCNMPSSSFYLFFHNFLQQSIPAAGTHTHIRHTIPSIVFSIFHVWSCIVSGVLLASCIISLYSHFSHWFWCWKFNEEVSFGFYFISCGRNRNKDVKKVINIGIKKPAECSNYNNNNNNMWLYKTNDEPETNNKEADWAKAVFFLDDKYDWEATCILNWVNIVRITIQSA